MVDHRLYAQKCPPQRAYSRVEAQTSAHNLTAVTSLCRTKPVPRKIHHARELGGVHCGDGSVCVQNDEGNKKGMVDGLNKVLCMSRQGVVLLTWFAPPLSPHARNNTSKVSEQFKLAVPLEDWPVCRALSHVLSSSHSMSFGCSTL